MDWGAGRYVQALARHQQSLVIRRELGDRPGQVASLLNLGIAYQRQARFEQALTCLWESGAPPGAGRLSRRG